MRLPLLATALIALAALGCQNETPEVHVPEKPAPETLTPDSKPETTPEPVAKFEEGENPDRIYQLSKLEKGKIKVNGTSVPVWLMNDDGKRQEGMMFLTAKEAPRSHGMLFVFPQEQGAERGFWMDNTVLPLDIVYISKDFKVVSAVKGKPFDQTSLPALFPFQYVLELQAGEAEKLKIKRGSMVEIPASLRKSS